MKMRVPFNSEWNKLVELTGGDDAKIHWKNMYSWVNDVMHEYISAAYPDDQVYRGKYAADGWRGMRVVERSDLVGFRPACLVPESLLGKVKEGESIIIGTLYMGGKPVRVPQKPWRDGDIEDYIQGARLEMRESLEDPAYQVTGIRVGDVFIADRNLLKCISYEDLAPENAISKVRIPRNSEWIRIVALTGGDDAKIHWAGMFSWGDHAEGEKSLWPNFQECFGCKTLYTLYHFWKHARRIDLGLRPVVERSWCSLEPEIKEGAPVIIGTLFMDGKPVKVPQGPTWDEDVENYIPGAVLELREALEDPAYQVTGIKVGNAFIADRCLLKNISYEDIKIALLGRNQ